MPVVSLSFEHHEGDSTILLNSTPVLRENTLGCSGSPISLLLPPTSREDLRIDGYLQRWLPPCCEGTIHLQISMPSPGFEPRSYGTTGIRVCGKRLSDLLQFVCRHFGGFYAPQWKRSAMGGPGNWNPFITKSQAVLGFRLRKSPEKRQFAAVPQYGIVNECCRQQCPLTTLVSYCALGDLTDEERLAKIISLFSSRSEILEDDFGKLDSHNQELANEEPIEMHKQQQDMEELESFHSED
ncbi:ilGF domain-containing protein [Trichonephila clavipes]|nr:ilGF domain-containing protein [Trichonephila clavipes]